MDRLRLLAGCPINSARLETRIFAEIEGGLVDLRMLCALYFAKIENDAHAYNLADLWFPSSMALFLERGESSRKVLSKLMQFFQETDHRALSGPYGERISYSVDAVKLQSPVQQPEKTLVVGFSEQIEDIQAKRSAGIPTAFYKLSSTLIGPGDPIVYSRLTGELDCDICLGVVIGRAGKRIPRDRALQYVGGFTLLVDVTARDLCRRESVTRNNLLGKNVPSSSPLGPSLVLEGFEDLMEGLPIELTVDGSLKQRFTLRDVIFSVEDVIAHWSTVGLSPGDVLALGAGLALKSGSPPPPAVLRPGSIVRYSCPIIGESTHRVVTDSAEVP